MVATLLVLMSVCFTGNLWAESWENILNDVLPYPEADQINITYKMIELVSIGFDYFLQYIYP